MLLTLLVFHLDISGTKALNRKLFNSQNQPPDPNDKDLQEPPPQTDVPPPDGQQAPTPAITHTRPPVVPASINPAQSQEEKIIELLLNRGNEIISIIAENENGEKVEMNYTVAQIIVDDILGDQMTFDDAVCQIVFNEYARWVQEGATSFDTQFFVTHEDDRVREKALTMMMTDYHLSENWAKLKRIYVPSPEERLREDVEDSLYTFKLVKLNKKIDDIDRQFPYLENEEDRLILMSQKMALLKVKQQLGQKLHRVIT